MVRIASSILLLYLHHRGKIPPLRQIWPISLPSITFGVITHTGNKMGRADKIVVVSAIKNKKRRLYYAAATFITIAVNYCGVVLWIISTQTQTGGAG
jgi:hypothetical protein